MSTKRSILAPNDRYLLLQGSLRIDDNLYVDDNTFIGNSLYVDVDATIRRDLFVERNAFVDVDLTVGNDAEIGQDLFVRRNAFVDVDLTVGNNANIVGTTFTSRLEVSDETILNTQTTILGNLDVVGFSTVSGTTIITATAGNTTTINGNLIVTGDDYQQFGNADNKIELYYGEDMYLDNLFVDFAQIEDLEANNIIANTLIVNLRTELNNETFINGNLFVNGVNSQTIGSTANLIENYFGENITTETLTVNTRTELNNETFINGNLFVNGVESQNIGSTANLIENYFGENVTTENLTVNTLTELNTDTTINDNLEVVGGSGTQRIGTADDSRVDEIWSIEANINDLTVDTETELGGDVTILGNGNQVFGQDSPASRINEYYGENMDLSDDLRVRGDITLDGDLFMTEENKKDFLDLDVQYVIYVKKNGDDNRSGQNISNSVRTIRRGLEIARKFREQNPVTDLDANTTTIMVSVYPGIYVEEGELEVPENGAIVSAGGQYVTEIHASEACRRNHRNMFWLNSGSYVQGFSFRNQEVDDFDDPAGGFAFAFAPGALIKRSPYIRDSSQLSNYNPTAVAAPLDPANANPAVGKGAGMILADRRILNPNSIFPYILAFGATPRSPNGIGYCARDGAGINGISSLGIFQRICFYALNGGQVTLNNSGTQFGDISMRATGSIRVVEEKTTDAVIADADLEIVGNMFNQSATIVNNMWLDLVAESEAGNVPGPDGNIGTSWNSPLIYDQAKCQRDVGFILDAATYDMVLGTNYNSTIAGQAYQRSGSQNVLRYQLQPTLDAIDYVRDYIVGDTSSLDDLAADEDNDTSNVTISGLIDPALPESGLSLADESRVFIRESFETVREILSINRSTNIVFNNPVTAEPEEIYAKDLLQLNRGLIQSEVIDFVNTTFPNLIYNEEKCNRDVGFIVDALTHDVLYGGNFANRNVATSYFAGVESQLGSELERAATLAAYERMKLIVSSVVLGTYPNQQTIGNVATSVESTTVSNLLDITIDVLTDGNTGNLAALVSPDISGATTQLLADYATIISQKSAIQTATTNFIDDRYNDYYETLTKRDATNLIRSVTFDLASGTQMVTQSFALGLFGIYAIKVYPELQEPAFIHTWNFIKDQLILIAGAISPEANMIRGLFDDVLISTIQNPTIIEFSSLIESLGHQFNNAGAGVNRNALPLNFRQPGFNRPVPFSVLQERGGRVRWSGADELNNQYFAGGTRINGLTGKFEGRPFNISVRQISRRIANSRGTF
jgi:hypothetical protein